MSIFLIYIAGMISIFLFNAYFNWDDFSSAKGGWIISIAMFWPIFLPIILPICLLVLLASFLNRKGIQHRLKKAERTKIRISKEIEMQKLMQESEDEVEKLISESQRKSI